MFLTSSMIEKKLKGVGKVLVIKDDKIVEITIQNFWNLIEDYASSKVSNILAQEMASGQTAIDAEVRYDNARAEMRMFLGLPPENL